MATLHLQEDFEILGWRQIGNSTFVNSDKQLHAVLDRHISPVSAVRLILLRYKALDVVQAHLSLQEHMSPGEILRTTRDMLVKLNSLPYCQSVTTDSVSKLVGMLQSGEPMERIDMYNRQGVLQGLL
jgi:hypothetical protein